ncbi:DUF2846 domain-containing protein [Microbulbifer sp. ANSA005]|uniref:DUF2846 domain-containing protein n=1 Tax=Microbulbifer sp. ANSA005 TaxID=3243362 RepID=UPI0040421C39
MKLKIDIFSILFLFLTGCASSPPQDAKYFQEISESKGGYAKLYIYRPNFRNGSAVWPEVFFNSTKIVGLKNHSYTQVFIQPGKYKIRTEKSSFISGLGNIPGEIEIKSTEDHFLFLEQYYCQTEYSNAYCLVNGRDMDYQRWVMKSKPDALRALGSYYYVTPYVEVVNN